MFPQVPHEIECLLHPSPLTPAGLKAGIDPVCVEDPLKRLETKMSKQASKFKIQVNQAQGSNDHTEEIRGSMCLEDQEISSIKQL